MMSAAEVPVMVSAPEVPVMVAVRLLQVAAAAVMGRAARMRHRMKVSFLDICFFLP